MNARYIEDCVTADLSQKMVFIGGPRQVGKTTCALSILPGKDRHSAILPGPPG
jgi:predicted AAA+ superfamily ATPase